MGIFKLNGIDYMGGGGGGNSNDRELTWDEYQALPDAEKYNDTNYYITDVNSDGTSNEFQPIIYSENEREIGVWTDGKPLYQKSFTGTWNVSSAWVDTNVIIPNGWAIKAEAVVYENDGNAIQVLSNISPTGHVFLFSLRAGSTYVVNYFTIWYTKTTDQPGSGTWTPQGTPAAHYSTDEQVVGTWVDGSTIYERSINLGSFSVSSGGEYTIEATPEIDTFLGYEGYAVENSIKYILQDPGIRIKIGNNNLIFQCSTGSSWNVSEGYITIRYTKQSSS